MSAQISRQNSLEDISKIENDNIDLNNEQIEILDKKAALQQGKKKTIRKIIKKKNPDGSDVVIKEVKRIMVDKNGLKHNLNDISVIENEDSIKTLQIQSNIQPEIVERTAVVSL